MFFSFNNSDNTIFSFTVLGSRDGFIRLWRRDDEKHLLVPVSKIPVVSILQF